MIWVLFAAPLISLMLGDWPDSLAIAAIIIINTAIYFSMKWQAATSMEVLKKLIKSSTRVKRNGLLNGIMTEELVPGDIMLVEAGNIVAAEGRIVESHELSVKESTLTGESEDVNKKIGILPMETLVADRTNMVHKGTIVSHGDATLWV